MPLMSRPLALALVLLRGANAERVQGSVAVPAHRMVFLHKFCFDWYPEHVRAGEWSGTLHSSTDGDLELVLFDDEEESLEDSNHIDWGLQCGSERLEHAAHGLIHLNGGQLNAAGGHELSKSGIVEQLRPRWWYMAVVDCSGKDRELDYSLHLLNVKQGWQSELSMDKCGLVVMVLFCASYVMLLSAQAYANTLECSANMRHPLRVCLTVALEAAVGAAVVQLVDTVSEATSGMRRPALYVAGKLFKWVSKLLLVSAIMLISRGHGISHPLRRQNLLRACRLLAPLFLGCLVLDLTGEYKQSHRYTTDSAFCSLYGAILVLFDVCMLLVFARNLCRSFFTETDAVKRRFFAMWGPVYAVAFCILPVATLVAYVVSPWVQVRVVFILTNSAHLALLGVLTMSLWPERSLPAFCIDNEELTETYGMMTDLLPSLLQKKGAGAEPRKKAELRPEAASQPEV